MSVSYKEVRNERQWKATTGLSEQEFNSLSIAFGQAYERLHEVSLEQGANNLKQELTLSTYADCLYFVLFQLKTGLTLDCLGVVFNMDGSSALRNFQKYLTVLEVALQQQQAMPRRHFHSLQEFKKYLGAEPEIITDVTEIRTERPADKQIQQDRYSGKKKPYR
jgi:hypothetical protein